LNPETDTEHGSHDEVLLDSDYGFAAGLRPDAVWSRLQHKARAIILTDIEADPDDTESLVKFAGVLERHRHQGFDRHKSTTCDTRFTPSPPESD